VINKLIINFIERFLVCLFLLLVIEPSSTLKINCDFNYVENCLRSCYECVVQKLIITKPNQNTTAVNGYHFPQQNDERVRTMRVIDQLVVYMPTGIYQHFPYLSVLKIWSSGLRSLEQKDIRDLKYLTDLSFSGNRLETLNSDLFVYNTRLIKIDFTRNRLRNLGYHLLTPLQNLIFADFYQNDCISDGARYSFDKLSTRLREKCQPTTAMMTEEVQSLSNEIENLKREIEKRDMKVSICLEQRHPKLDSLFPSIMKRELTWEGQS